MSEMHIGGLGQGVQKVDLDRRSSETVFVPSGGEHDLLPEDDHLFLSLVDERIAEQMTYGSPELKREAMALCAVAAVRECGIPAFMGKYIDLEEDKYPRTLLRKYLKEGIPHERLSKAQKRERTKSLRREIEFRLDPEQAKNFKVDRLTASDHLQTMGEVLLED